MAERFYKKLVVLMYPKCRLLLILAAELFLPPQRPRPLCEIRRLGISQSWLTVLTASASTGKR
jgi:hypothetical protein